VRSPNAPFYGVIACLPVGRGNTPYKMGKRLNSFLLNRYIGKSSIILE
jgi:hypothetical protein